MISPILIRRELKFLESLDFQTRYYFRHQLQDETFREENPEAKFATKIFGTEKGVGTASLLWERTLTPEWQAKKEEKKQEFLKPDFLKYFFLPSLHILLNILYFISNSPNYF